MSQPSWIARYWGKARPPADTPPGEPRWHPAAYHMLDVAAVAERLLIARPHLTTQAERLMPGLPTLVPLLVALHDLGKMSPWFQRQCPDLVLQLTGAEPAASAAVSPRHDAAGLLLWQRLYPLGDLLAERTGQSSRVLDILMPAVLGHHGQPPENLVDKGYSAELALPSGDPEDVMALATALADLLAPAQAPAPVDPRQAAPAAWLLAGVTIAADWIGSNTEWFPYHAPDLDLATYWHKVARPAAIDAVNKAGLEPPKPAPVRDFAALTGLEGATPSPLQALCQRLPVAEGPQVVVIEDVTGSGKTEAALILANHMLAAGAAERLFIGLPTMATANAMFGRLGAAYRRLFENDARPTLGLAHGRADLHEGFRAARIAGRQPEADAAAGDDGAGTASMLANTWLSDSRKKALLADVGVGTIDQALIGTLAARHQALRLLGVSGGVLVVDEVHAYDAYTGRLLAGLLTFQAALGGSAVIMSATLAAHQRRALVEAFAQGLGRTLPPEPEDAAPALYPLVTRWSEADDTAVAEAPEPPPAPAAKTRRLRCARLEEAGEAVRLLVETARTGGCGCWVRNTVADAREGFEMLRAHLPPDDLMLFHAAFIPAHRQDVETRVLDTFGKGEGRPRAGKILVATQVVEQSLDVDFDAMVTDLAPVDLLIQRAGRQHRHKRGPRPDPILHVLGPDAVDDPAEDWYARVFRAGAHVYEDHGRLWLTQRLLTGPDAPPEGWDLIADARHLIETVYGPDALDAVPPGLQESSCAAEGTEWAAKNLADRARLRPERKYSIQNTPWEDDVAARTRLGEDRVTLVLAVEGPGATLVPLSRAEAPEAHAAAGPFDRRRAWAESEVSVSARRVDAAAPLPPHLARAGEAVRDEQRWPDDRPLLVLLTPAEESGGWTGQALRDEAPVVLTYGRESGLAYA